MSLWRGASWLAMLVLLAPSPARAEDPSPSASDAPSAPATPADGPPGSARGASTRPSTSPAESGPSTPSGSRRPDPPKRATERAGPPRVVSTGFETLGDGSTRLYVELSKNAAYETKTLHGKIAYILKGTRVARRNNANPLITVDFNTPVTSARLVPHGRDLWLIVKLRQSVDPAVTTDATKDGGLMLRVTFPKGDYLPKGKSTASARLSRAARDGVRGSPAPTAPPPGPSPQPR